MVYELTQFYRTNKYKRILGWRFLCIAKSSMQEVEYFVEVDVTYLESNNFQSFETFIISDFRGNSE